MVRKTFNYSLFTLLLIFSAPVFSLGLGEIDVDSALNQPLVAKINLIATRADDLEELRVELAPADVFDRVGVPRPYFLTQMKFEPIISPGGGAVIRVTSKDPVREPFLTFLVEVSWPKGRLLREYTVLLDPPEFAQQQAPQISTPTAVATPAPEVVVQDVVDPKPVVTEEVVTPTRIATATTQAAEPEKDIEEIRAEIDRRLGLDADEESAVEKIEEAAIEETAPTAEEIEVTVAKDVAEEAKASEELIEVEPIAVNENQAADVIVPEDIPEAEASSEESVEDVSPTINADEYVTAKGDTLYAVAKATKASPEHSINQMMLAIQQANPDAFLQNNINLLKSGVVLRIPDDASIEATNNSDAKKEIIRQTNIWREYRQQVADKMVATNVDAPDLVEESADTTQTTKQQPEQGDSAKRTKQELTILAGNEDGQSEEGAKSANVALSKLQKELSLSNELAQSKSKQNEELKSRIEALESILEKKEKIINIQNDQLKQLQDKINSDTEVAASTEKQLKELQQQLKEAQAAVAATAAEKATIEAEAAEAAEAAQAAAEAKAIAEEESAKVEQQVAKVEKIISKPKLEPLPDWDSLPDIQPIEEPTTEVESTTEVEQTTEAETVAETPTASETTAEVKPEVTPKVKPEVNVEAPVTPVSEDGIMTMLKKNWQLALGIPAALLAMLLGFFALRQRRAANAMETIDLGSIPAEAMDDDEFDDILDETIVTPQTNNESNVFQEDQNASDSAEVFASNENTDSATAQSSSEVAPDDVIEEADVYISYGLHQQAEDLLKESIQREPNRHDFKVKLAEVYYSQKNEQAFQNYAESVKDELGESSSEWQNIISMGKQIAPASALFAGATVAAAATSSEKPVTADIDLGLDTAMSNPLSDDDLEDTVLDNDEGNDNSLDFDVEETVADEFVDDFEDDPVASKIMEANETSDILNFDIDDLADELDDESELEASQTGIMDAVSFNEGSDDETLESAISEDLDDVGMHTTMDDLKPMEMDEGVLDNTVALSAEDLGTDLVDTTAAEADKTMAYQTSEDDKDLENAATAAYQASETDVRSSTDLKADLEELSADLDATEQLDADQLDTEFLDVSENTINQTATDLHELGPPSLIEEVGTKLDLAKAFADMGDSDAAKETLLEVINEGDESQVVAAKDLMSKLGG